MFTSKEIVDYLKENNQDNNWYVDTKKIGTPPNHRFFSPTLVRNHVTEAHKQLSAKQKKIAAMAGDKDKIDADDLAKLRSMKEDAEQLDEISSDLALNYAKKAFDSGDDKRAKGLNLAIKKASARGAKVPTTVKEEKMNKTGLSDAAKKSITNAMVKHYGGDASNVSFEHDKYSGHTAHHEDNNGLTHSHSIKIDGNKVSLSKHPHAVFDYYAEEAGLDEASDIDKLGKKYAKAEKDEAEKQDTYSKKYPGGEKQKKADKDAFMKRFAEEEMRPEIAQIIENAMTKAWMNVHTKGSKAAREKLDKVHAKNPAYHAFKKSLEGHSSGPASKPEAEKKAPVAASKSSEETPAQKLRRINSERQKAYYAKGGGRGVGSAGTSANLSPLEKKLGGHNADVSSLEKKKTTALGASDSERKEAKVEKKEKEKASTGDRLTKKLTGKVGI